MIVIPSGVIFIWTGTHASIPTGWERVTALDGLYSKGTADATNPNQTGGAATHEHSASANHGHTMNNHTHTITINAASPASTSSKGDSGTNGSTSQHTHASITSGNPTSVTVTSVSAVYSSYSNNPPYYEVIFIKPSDANRTGVPVNAIALKDNLTEPTGWKKCDGNNSTPNLTDKYLRGAAASGNAGGTGGSLTNAHTTLTHTHQVTHSHTGTTSTGGRCGGSTGSSYVAGTHTHSITVTDTNRNAVDATLSAQSETVEPAYTYLAAMQNQNASADLPLGIIGLWLGSLATIPTGWTLCDGGNSTVDMRGRHLKITNTLASIGTTGGSNTHTHASQTHGHTVSHSHTGTASHTSAIGPNNKSPTYQCLATATHALTTDSVNYVLADANTSADSANNEPLYKTVAFIKLVSQNFTSTLTESMAVSENFKRSAGKLLSEAINTAETFVKRVSKTLSEAITSSELFATVVGYGVIFEDLVNVGDSIRKALTREVSEAVSITESVSKGILRGLTELVNYVDTTTKSIGKLLLSEINVQETISFIKGKVFTEVVNISESFTKVRSAFLTFLETISITETILKILDKIPGIGNWLRVHSHQDTPPALEGDNKPTSGEGTDKGFMSSSEDTPTGTILNEDRPSL